MSSCIEMQNTTLKNNFYKEKKKNTTDKKTKFIILWKIKICDKSNNICFYVNFLICFEHSHSHITLQL